MLHSLAASLLLLALSAVAAESSRNPAVIETEALQVILEITRDREDTLFNFVDVTVDDDVVTLSGTVRHKSRGTQIEREIAQISGVRAVRNELRSPRMGVGDERLRRELVQGIYGHLSLSRYRLFVAPPIRILVEQGRVVLAGRVAATVERELLRQIASRSEAYEVAIEVAVDADVVNEPRSGVGVSFP
jgi:osmotically-inducible protein OsmY